MKSTEAISAARQMIGELTGLRIDTVAGVRPHEQGWMITLVLIESKGVPDSRDLLATYEIQLDPTGDLISYQRTDRYLRGRV
jgi:hypothetical protein